MSDPETQIGTRYTTHYIINNSTCKRRVSELKKMYLETIDFSEASKKRYFWIDVLGVGIVCLCCGKRSKASDLGLVVNLKVLCSNKSTSRQAQECDDTCTIIS